MSDLEGHYSDVFKALGLDKTMFSQYVHGADDIPDWAKGIIITHEYMFYCASNSEKMQRLSNFLGRDIFQRDKVFYWFDGDEIEHLQKTEETSSIIKPESMAVSGSTERSLEKSVTLPAWLDALIFEELQARYAPSGHAQEFNNNLNRSQDDILVYLGTYFPRSYAESFCIFNNLFSNDIIRSAYKEKRTIRIFDVGSGTCGDLIGLLAAIADHFSKIKEVYITAVDGNNEALSIAKTIIKESRKRYNFNIDLRAENYTLSTFKGFNNETCILTEPSSVDFILSSKMINELLASKEYAVSDSYYDFAAEFLPLLKSRGLCLLLDITTKSELSDSFHPRIFNEQVNRALRDIEGFQTLIPLSCNLYSKKCRANCFSQRTFYVSHSKKQQDKSKVCYRVIGRKALIDQIGQPPDDCKYEIADDLKETCVYSDSEERAIVDAFILAEMAHPELTAEKKAEDNIIPIGEWEEVLSQLFDDNAKEFARGLIKQSIKPPSGVGFEMVDNNIVYQAEMIWHAERIAFLLPDSLDGKKAFTKAGWRVVSAISEFLSDENAEGIII
jgi:hypothetical protein